MAKGTNRYTVWCSVLFIAMGWLCEADCSINAAATESHLPAWPSFHRGSRVPASRHHCTAQGPRRNRLGACRSRSHSNHGWHWAHKRRARRACRANLERRQGPHGARRERRCVTDADLSERFFEKQKMGKYANCAQKSCWIWLLGARSKSQKDCKPCPRLRVGFELQQHWRQADASFSFGERMPRICRHIGWVWTMNNINRWVCRGLSRVGPHDLQGCSLMSRADQ